MGHAYHRHCGCSACCDVELADERRDEYIDQYAPQHAAKLVGAEDFAWDVTTDFSREVQQSLMQDLGRFFTAYHKARTDTDEAVAGYGLYRTLKPYIEAAALSQAKDEVAAEFDRDEPQQAAA